MPKPLIADRSSIRTPTETVAALIALAAHRKQLTRWITTKQDVMDLLENYPNMRKRVRSSAFNTALLIAMNEYDIAMFEIDRFTWGFVTHQRTKTWRRVGFAGLTEADLKRPDVIALEAEFGYREEADAPDSFDDSSNLEIPDMGFDHPKRPKRIKRSGNKSDYVVLLARLNVLLDTYNGARSELVATAYQRMHLIQLSRNPDELAELIKFVERSLLAPEAWTEGDMRVHCMTEISRLQYCFDTQGLIRDAHGNECEVTQRHIAERKWDMFLPNELPKLLEGLKDRLRERYNAGTV